MKKILDHIPLAVEEAVVFLWVSICMSLALFAVSFMIVFGIAVISKLGFITGICYYFFVFSLFEFIWSWMDN